MNILFICKHNRFRSKVAEAIFKKYVKNKKHKARSRATEPDYIPVAKSVQEALREIGIKRVDRKPRKLKKEDLDWADLIIVVADNVNLRFKGKDVLRWKISDTSQKDYSGILLRVRQIEKKILNLVKNYDKINA